MLTIELPVQRIAEEVKHQIEPLEGVAEKKGGGLEADQRGPYAARDVAVPFSTMSKAQQKAKGLSRAEKKLQKELPYLSNYADYVPTQINPMYNDPNSGAFSNQTRRDQAAGVVGQAGLTVLVVYLKTMIKIFTDLINLPILTWEVICTKMDLEMYQIECLDQRMK